MSTITNNQIADILNDLVRINNDRIEWYEKALQDLKPEDRDLEPVFSANLLKSQVHNELLSEEIADLDLELARGTTVTGEIYRAWADVISIFNGRNRHAVLINCEAGEIAAQKAYQTALENPLVPGYLKEILGEQKEDLEKMRHRIQSMKDAAF
jgi:uncharacterized protein (TIGR02284 family)